MIKFMDLFYMALIPLIAGLTAIAVARTKRANTYSPILALGIILMASGVVVMVSLLVLSVLSMVI